MPAERVAGEGAARRPFEGDGRQSFAAHGRRPLLVLRPGALGDTLLAVPALRALRQVFGPVTLAAHAAAARLLASVGEVDGGIAFDDPSLGWLFANTAAQQLPVAVVAWMNSDRAPALKHALLVAPGRPSGEQHCAAYLVKSLAPLGLAGELAPLGLAGELDARPLTVAPVVSNEVLIHPGSGSAAKNWPAARFAATIAALDCPIRLIVGEADAAVALAVESALGRNLPRLEHAPLEELAARLAGCRAYVGNDSGISHLAGLCGARAVVLFGPTSPTVWHPLGPRVHTEPFDIDPSRVVDLIQADW